MRSFVRGTQRSAASSGSAGMSKGTAGSGKACVEVDVRARLASNSAHDFV